MPGKEEVEYGNVSMHFLLCALVGIQRLSKGRRSWIR